MKELIEEGEVREAIKQALDDPILALLLENSNLTRVQFETYLIEVLTENQFPKKIKYDLKAFLRQQGKISRGSFKRTLIQAQNNVIRSIFTVLLLSYLGVLSSSALSEFEVLANKLKDYVENYREIQTDPTLSVEEKIQEVTALRDAMEKALRNVAKEFRNSQPT